MSGGMRIDGRTLPPRMQEQVAAKIVAQILSRPVAGRDENIKEYKEEIKMKKYIGTKMVQAEPAFRLVSERGCDIHPKDQVPVFEERAVIEDGYKVVYSDGCVIWSPKAVFEESFREVNGMNFGLAVEAMKRGKRVARRCWDRDVYLFLGTAVEFHTEADISEFENQDVPVGEVIVLRSVDREFVPGWLPVHVDILADDWYIVE